MNTEGGHINQCNIFIQIYILIVTPGMTGGGIKEANTWTTRIISNRINWYQLHKGTQGISDWVNK